MEKGLRSKAWQLTEGTGAALASPARIKLVSQDMLSVLILCIMSCGGKSSSAYCEL